MADKEITSLPASGGVQDNDAFVLARNGVAEKVLGSQLKAYTMPRYRSVATLPATGEFGIIYVYNGHAWQWNGSTYEDLGAFAPTESGAVKYDTAQVLSSTQKATAMSNIGVGSLGNAIGMQGWNQLVVNGDFADGTNGWTLDRCSAEVSGGVLTGTVTTSGYLGVYKPNMNYKSGHIILAKVDVWAESATTGYISRRHRYQSPVISTPVAIGNSWTTLIGIATIVEDSYTDLAFNIPSGYAVGLTFKLKNFGCFDLTEIFGAGNEPSTVAEFRSMFPADYYPYCQWGFGDLLWTNASPTSSFSVQTISLDLSKYRFALIIFRDTTSSTSYKSDISQIGANSNVLSMDSSKTISRQQDVVSTAITFNSGYIYSAYGTNTTDNNKLIPYQIYGIR